MKCQNCNFDNPNDRIFCKKCGYRLPKTESNQSKNAKTQQTLDEFMNASEKHYNKGCAAQAWEDIKNSEHWIKKLLLLGLCNIIPILNFSAAGFTLKWAQEITSKSNKQVSKEIINSSNIKLGLYEWLVWFAYGFVFIITSLLLSSVFNNILAILAAIVQIILFVIAILWNSCVSLACLKMTISKEKLASAFQFKDIFEAFKQKTSKLLCAYFIPALICGVIVSLFVFLIGLTFLSNQFGNMAMLNTASATGAFTSSSMFYAMIILFNIALFFIFSYVFIAFFTGIERVIRYRAIAYYIVRYVDNWL